MAFHRNPSIANWFRRIFNFKVGDMPTSQVSDIIIPVIPVLPIANIVETGTVTNATSGTVFTTPTDKDFYLTGASLSMIKDVLSQSVSTDLRAVLRGITIFPLTIRSISLTIQNDSKAQIFNPPIKLDRGTTVTITNSNATAEITASATIYGYTQETISSDAE